MHMTEMNFIYGGKSTNKKQGMRAKGSAPLVLVPIEEHFCEQLYTCSRLGRLPLVDMSLLSLLSPLSSQQLLQIGSVSFHCNPKLSSPPASEQAAQIRVVLLLLPSAAPLACREAALFTPASPSMSRVHSFLDYGALAKEC